jgi:hypothetical protein
VPGGALQAEGPGHSLEARHAADTEGALFWPVSNNRTGQLDNPITPDGVNKLVRRYALSLGLKIGAHALHATAATTALDHNADITKVQEWLGHANIATTIRFSPCSGCPPVWRPTRKPIFEKQSGTDGVNGTGSNSINETHNCAREPISHLVTSACIAGDRRWPGKANGCTKQ